MGRNGVTVGRPWLISALELELDSVEVGASTALSLGRVAEGTCFVMVM
jgi:hypothetical protein